MTEKKPEVKRKRLIGECALFSGQKFEGDARFEQKSSGIMIVDVSLSDLQRFASFWINF